MKIRLTAHDPCAITIEQSDEGIEITIERVQRDVVVQMIGGGGGKLGAAGSPGSVTFGTSGGGGASGWPPCHICTMPHNPTEHAGGGSMRCEDCGSLNHSTTAHPRAVS